MVKLQHMNNVHSLSCHIVAFSTWRLLMQKPTRLRTYCWLELISLQSLRNLVDQKMTTPIGSLIYEWWGSIIISQNCLHCIGCEHLLHFHCYIVCLYYLLTNLPTTKPTYDCCCRFSFRYKVNEENFNVATNLWMLIN